MENKVNQRFVSIHLIHFLVTLNILAQENQSKQKKGSKTVCCSCRIRPRGPSERREFLSNRSNIQLETANLTNQIIYRPTTNWQLIQGAASLRPWQLLQAAAKPHNCKCRRNGYRRWRDGNYLYLTQLWGGKKDELHKIAQDFWEHDIHYLNIDSDSFKKHVFHLGLVWLARSGGRSPTVSQDQSLILISQFCCW